MKYADRPFIVEMKWRRKKVSSGAIWSDVDMNALKQALGSNNVEPAAAIDPLPLRSTSSAPARPHVEFVSPD